VKINGIKLLFFIILLHVSSQTAFAFELIATNSAIVSASVPSTTFNPPTLVSPKDNSATNNTREALVWQRPSPLPVTPLHHYDVYLDGQIFAASVSDSITTQTYYFYTITRSDNTFTLNFNTDLAQGYHTWSVTAYNTYGINVSSETWTFYVDSVVPNIKLQKVDSQTLNWDTGNPVSIPDISLRLITVGNPNPLLSGTVEPYANLQIILLCPQNIRNCHNQIWQGNYPTGLWQNRFYGLVRGHVYTVYLAATDAAGNSTIFPDFYLIYGSAIPTPSAIITPTAIPTPPVSPSISPTETPTPTLEITPTPFVPVPPVSPTPPVFNNSAQPAKTFNYFIIFFVLLAVGLPLHLLMTVFGAQISFANLLRFLFTLIFPFIGRKNYQTIPFATLLFYNPEKLDTPWQTKISDINGFFSLPSPIPEKLFIKVVCVGRHWSDVILPGNLLSSICLFPILQNPQTASDRLRHRSLTLRSLPLALACLTSAICLYLQPNYFYLIYLYLSLQLVFSEYLYPKISK